MISTQKLTKQYGDVRALDEISLVIHDGEFVALLGPNGSGKSTLFRSLLGIQSYEGLIRVNGCDPMHQGKATRRQIGYMPQHSGLHGELTVQETINFYCRLKHSDISRALELLERVQLSSKLTSRVSELSGGMRQRLAFAIALLADPEILLLDEPTASLDSRSQTMILDWLLQLHEEGKTILISTHSKQDIMSLAMRAITLEEGKVVSDKELPKNASGVIISTQDPRIKTVKEAALCCAI
jgi:ABC-type multidrug transport system ATPase subunit